MRSNRHVVADKRSTVAVIAAAASTLLARAACGAETCHDAAIASAPSATGVPWIDFFTGGGHYMPRTHCLTLADGTVIRLHDAERDPHGLPDGLTLLAGLRDRARRVVVHLRRGDAGHLPVQDRGDLEVDEHHVADAGVSPVEAVGPGVGGQVRPQPREALVEQR